jgi:hypothetical protein
VNRLSLESYVAEASDASLGNSVLMKLAKVAKHKRSLMAELEQIIEELAEVKFIQQERERRSKQLKVVDTKQKVG